MSNKVSAALNQRLAAIAKSMSGHVDVGFLETAKYPDGTYVAAVAYANEYGGDNRPPRPFFRRMIAEEKPEWPADTAAIAKATNNNGPEVLKLMGENIQGALIQSINDLTDPPLAPYTIKKKGFDKPLIETAVMVNSTGVDVETK